MKITGNTHDLALAAENCSKAMSKNSDNKALTGILFNAAEDHVELTGYDLELGITTSVTVRVEEPGKTVMDKTIIDILKKLPNDVVCIQASEKTNKVSIKSGDMSYNLVCFSPENYPEIPEIKESGVLEISGELYKLMLRQTIYSVAKDVKDQKKIICTGVKFEISRGLLKLIAVDGFRFAISQEPVAYNGDDAAIVIPAKSLTEISRLVDDNDLQMVFGKKHVLFTTGRYTVFSRLLDGNFLNYHAALPKSSATTVRVQTREMIESIERIAVIIADRIKAPIRCNIADDLMHFSVNTAIGSAEDTISVDVNGADVEIGFNYRFIVDALKASDSDEVFMKFNGPVAPIVITPTDGDNFLHLVLPVRLKAE